MKAALKKKVRAERRLQETRAKLSKIPLITSISELQNSMDAIDAEEFSTQKKVKEKLKLIKLQMQIRKVLLGEKMNIQITKSRRQRPLCQIIKEFTDHLAAHSSGSETTEHHRHLVLEDPTYLVGKNILHRFITQEMGDEVWYAGLVIDYQHAEKQHVIQYEGEEQQLQYFDLTIDFMEGDLIIDS